MKMLIIFVSAVASVCGFIGFAETGAYKKFITHLKYSANNDPGQIPWPAFITLLAIGIIGILGTRRRKKI